MRLEPVILNALTHDNKFSDKVIPHLTAEYFHDDSEKLVFELMQDFVVKYGKLPPRDSLAIELENLDGLKEGLFEKTKEVLNSAYSDEYKYDSQWLVDQAEAFCKDKAIYNAIMHSVRIINGESKTEAPGAIPTIMTKALAVAFDTNVGHDYFEQVEARWDYYHKNEIKHRTRIDLINKITNGGPPSKSLLVFIASSGGGKSAVKCALAADWIRDGKNVLYITLELSEEKIGERIDANLLNIPISEVKGIDKERFTGKFQSLKEKGFGKLVIKEYPTSGASVNSFNLLMDELKQKQNFKPDIVIVDYLQIVACARQKQVQGANTYVVQKYIAEELRGFAVIHDVLVVTSVQTNRSGYNVTDFDETAISDSAGIIHTADALFAIIRDEQLKEDGKAIIKQLKNRWGDTTYYNKFVIGLDTSRMCIYNIETTPEPAQQKPKETNTNRKTDDWDFE